jgi:Mn-dependent DtxR family transcriptional regulator
MEQKSTQDYLKAIYSQSKNGDLVSTTEISQKLNVTPASVTEMLKKLSHDGYVNYSPYHGSTLTEKGLQEAQKVTRKHRLLETFLSDVLHIGKDKVHKEACQMEHALSDEAEESLCRLLKHPDICSDDGKTIPACDLPFSNCERIESWPIRQNFLHKRRSQHPSATLGYGANPQHKNNPAKSGTIRRTNRDFGERFKIGSWQRYSIKSFRRDRTHELSRHELRRFAKFVMSPKL